jgi:NADH dehydrogenase (ubiquinone) Fe-S protein 3
MTQLFTKYLENIIQDLPFVQLQIFQDEISGHLSDPNQLISSMTYLHSHTQGQYKILSCISGVDYPQRNNRFEVVYDILSIKYNNRFRLKTSIHSTSSLDSIMGIYLAANWWEREIWDLFGILFKNHKDLRRILTDYGFQGHPLRKDFPLTGYVEVRYDDSLKRVVSEPLQNLGEPI